jgi:ABC-type polysaccharide/polyol phosphate export permease
MVSAMLDHFRQLYQYRALVQILVIRELKARYRGTVLGFLWSFVNPLVLVVIYALVFSVYLRMDMPNYPAFLLCGIFPWTWFSLGLGEATNSIINNGGLIKKVYLPSELFPLVYVSSNMIHYLLTLPIQLLVLLFFRMPLSAYLVFVPLIVFLQLVFMYGLALILSSLAVQFRDLIYIVPNLLMVTFFLTPILYPSTVIPDRYNFLLTVNPVAHLVQSYQDVFYYDKIPSALGLSAMAVCDCILLFVGFSFFEARSDLFAEEV